MSELAFASATALAARVQSKDISAVELLNFFLARTDSYNGKLNAIVVDTREQALADAEQADAAADRVALGSHENAAVAFKSGHRANSRMMKAGTAFRAPCCQRGLQISQPSATSSARTCCTVR